MARQIVFNVPLDSPKVERPGVQLREADYPGAAKWLAVPPEDPVRAAKGDLGLGTIKGLEPRPLTGGGVPWKNLRGGR